MPVNRPPHGGHIGRSRRRLSSSSLTTFERCKGQWLLKTQVGLQQPVNIPMIKGHVIEDAVCQLLMRHPPLCTSEEELMTWCHSQIDEIVDLAMVQFGSRIDSLPKNSVEFSSTDIDQDDIKQRLLHCIPLIFEEVRHCHEQNGGPFVQEFRAGGEVFEVPAPCLSKPPCHPYPEYVQSSQPQEIDQKPIWQTKDDELTWNEAWEISRPWFKDPRVFQPQRLYHPDDWASGELDVVYRWSGTIHIIDIKSGNSNSPFASSLQSQLEFYAWLWSACFDGEIPTQLSGWYLGDGKHIKYQTLTQTEIEGRNTTYLETHHEMKNLAEGIVEFPLSAPLQCEGNQAGCSWCSARFENNTLQFKSKHADMHLPIFDFSPPFQQLSSIQSRVHVRGKLTGGWGPLPNHFGEYVLGCVLVVGDQHVVVEENEPGLFAHLHQFLEQDVVIENASSGVWRDQPRLYLDELSKISTQTDTQEIEITRLGLLQTRANVEGVILSIQQQSGTRLNGKPWTMLSFSLWDGNNIAEMVAFGSSISNTLLDLKVGSSVKIMSAEIGWRNGLLQLRFDSRKTRIEINQIE
jgi:hypothetical protein